MFELDGQRILICRSAAGFHAMHEICPHQLLSLEGGRVRNNFIMCPHHGARFNLEDGSSLSPLTTNGLTLYKTRVVGNQLEIDL